MSLLWHRGAIERAVAGELPPRREARLRAHLRACPRCRDHYDHLSVAAERLPITPRPDGGTAARRERDRLQAAVFGLPARSDDLVGARAPAPPRLTARPWFWAVVGATPAAAIVLLLLLLRAAPPQPRPDSAHQDESVTWRGTPAATAPSAVTLVVFASRKQPDGRPGPVRIVADLPVSGEGRVSLGDYVQFGVRGLKEPAFITVAAVDDQGGVHLYVPRPGAAPPRLHPAPGLVSMGSSVDLGHGHAPGRLRIYALFSTSGLDINLLTSALSRVDRNSAGAPPLDLSALGPPGGAGPLLAAPIGGVLTVVP